MRLFSILFALIISVGCASLNQRPYGGYVFKSTSVFDEEKSDCSIEGTVIDKATGEPILFCTVSLYNTKNGLLTGCDSDLDGHFNLSNLDEGEYSIETSYVGFHTLKTPKFTLSKGEKIQVTLPMVTGSHTEYLGCGPWYQIPLIQMDETTSGASFTKDDLKRMAW